MKGHFRYGYNVAVLMNFLRFHLKIQSADVINVLSLIYDAFEIDTYSIYIIKKSVPHPVGDALDEVQIEIDSTIQMI